MNKCEECMGAAAGDCEKCKWNQGDFGEEHSICEMCTDGELWEREEVNV